MSTPAGTLGTGPRRAGPRISRFLPLELEPVEKVLEVEVESAVVEAMNKVKRLRVLR